MQGDRYYDIKIWQMKMRWDEDYTNMMGSFSDSTPELWLMPWAPDAPGTQVRASLALPAERTREVRTSCQGMRSDQAMHETYMCSLVSEWR